jgi:hypothetical protein
LLCALGVLLWYAAAEAQNIRSDFYITNGTVNATILYGNRLYIGGSFTSVGAVTGAGVPLDATSGTALGGFPMVVGQVNAVAPDGAGGWFIGGLFTTVGGVPRSNLAHILADNSVSAWDPGTNGQVLALALGAGTVYVGGSFSNAGGQARNRIAALDAATGLASAWDPGANDLVRALAVSGSTVYAGGRFTTIGGQARNRLAALDAGTGLATAWNVSTSFDVFALAVGAGKVYVGGGFTSIGGLARNRIAAVDATTGAVTTWNPNASSQISALLVSGGTVYAGGFFTTIGGLTRNRIAALDATTGLATSWNPNANATVVSLASGPGTIYAGGDFLSIGGQARSRIAALDAATGAATPWDPSAYGTVAALAVSGSTVYAGGLFSGMGGQTRNNIAALDVPTGSVTSWNPDANNQVLALALRGGTLVVGGSFTTIGGQTRNNIAALDTTSGFATTWDPNSNGQVSALALDDGTVYAGGTFSAIGGQNRNNLAALDITTGLASPWNPNADGQIFALAISGGTIYAGGTFSTAGGQARDNIAALAATTGLATAWNPGPNGTIRSVVVSCGTVYVGGFFTTISGQNRNRIAALDATTGLASSWNPNANGPVFAVTLGGGRVYAGGVLNSIGGQTRNRLAALDPVTGLASAWNPNSNGTVRVIALGGGAVYAAGSFTAMGVLPQAGIAAIDADNSSSCPAIALTPPTVPTGVAGTAYAQTISASGGASPYCYAVTAGSLPAGLVLAAATGAISGTPTAAGTSVFTIGVTDANGCTGSESYTLSVFAAASASSVAANTAGLSISSAHPCVSVPIVFDRADLSPARGASVTFQIDTSKLALCLAGPPALSIHAGPWLAGFSNVNLQVVDNGGGSYTVDQAIFGQPCGVTTGGTLFTVDLKSVAGDGTGAITVTAVTVRGCDNQPLPGVPGAPAQLPILNTPIAILPATLPHGSTGSPYSQSLTAAAGVPPFMFTVSAGALPPGLTLSGAGVLSGTPTAAGTFNFTVGVADANDAPGSRAYSLIIDLVCPLIALLPAAIPDGSLGTAYTQTFTPSAGTAPFTYAVTSGALPAELSLSSGGVLSGTPTATGTSVFMVGVTDTYGCTSARGYTMTIFDVPPASSVAANTIGLCIWSAHPCVSVPIVFDRAEASPARGISVTFQIDVSKLSLCTPGTPAQSIHPASWLAGFTASDTMIVDNGGGSYTVDQAILGLPCGVTTGGTLFTVDLMSVAGDGTGAITVTAVKLRDCANQPLPARPGAPAGLAILNTPIAVLPPTLPNGLTGAAYAQTFTASAGTPPFTFALAAGALPPGLALSAGGVLSGTPSAAGTFAFTVSVTDANGVIGSRAYSVVVVCPPIALLPSALADGSIGATYDAALFAGAGAAPYAWSVTSGGLPGGFSLDAGTGAISGTPTAAGTAVFTIGVTDANGCTGSESYTLSVFAAPPASSVAASTAGLCISTAHPCVSVPVVFDRVESTPARGASVTFQIDTSKLALCTPGTPALSIHAGPWLAGFSNVNLQVLDNGGGSYTVDQAIFGQPCGVTTGGTLFTVDLKSVGGDGTGAVTVTSAKVRGCENQPLPGIPGAPALLTIDHLGPTPITDLTATTMSTGNGAGPTLGITLSWATGGSGTVSLYRAPFGTYPEYDDNGPVSPPLASSAPGAPWTLVTAAAAPGYIDTAAPRGFWYYVAFLTSPCGTSSASNRTPGTLNYHLGDVSNGFTVGQGDNLVRDEDISLLGANYGIGEAAITARGVEYLDVGPTTDLSPTSRPVTDDVIDFEDLMMFVANYQVVSAPQAAAKQAGTTTAREEFRVVAPSLVDPGEDVSASLLLRGAGRVQGFSVRLAWDASVVQPVDMRSSGFIEGQGGLVLTPRPGTVDAALLGARGEGMTGEGEVARVSFRVLRPGDPAIRLAQVVARDAANRPLGESAIQEATQPLVPARTILLSPAPNPSRGAATLVFSLAGPGTVELAVYSVDGRRVRTLVSEPREAGVYRAAWDGRDEGRNAVAPGVFYAHMRFAGKQFTKTLVILK